MVRNSWPWVAVTDEGMKSHTRAHFCLGDKWSRLLTDRQWDEQKHRPSIFQLSVSPEDWGEFSLSLSLFFFLLAIYVPTRKDGRIASSWAFCGF